MGTLVYVGANVGDSLGRVASNFDRVYAFEPDPEMFERLFQRYGQDKKFTLVNAACSLEDGEANFYITGNRVASSLGDGIQEFKDFHGYNAEVIKEITVKTINLAKYLKEEGVDVIHLYYSDCQGSDLNVLKTLKEWVDAGNIGELFLETHSEKQNIYHGLENKLSGFKELLSENFDLVHASLGCHHGRIVTEENIPPEDPEFDCYWRLKGEDPGVGESLTA
tara:strand:+ start:1268 stop:1933 length:666 start_codon:yes stop_codon:yes gene_type:complete